MELKPCPECMGRGDNWRSQDQPYSILGRSDVPMICPECHGIGFIRMEQEGRE